MNTELEFCTSSEKALKFDNIHDAVKTRGKQIVFQNCKQLKDFTIGEIREEIQCREYTLDEAKELATMEEKCEN